MDSDFARWERILVRTEEPAAAVADFLRAHRRLVHARVWSADPGWVTAATSEPDRGFVDQTAVAASRRLGTAVFRIGTSVQPDFEVYALGRPIYVGDGVGPQDTDWLAPWLPDGRKLAELRGQEPAALARLLNVPTPMHLPADALTVECVRKRWWEFWV